MSRTLRVTNVCDIYLGIKDHNETVDEDVCNFPKETTRFRATSLAADRVYNSGNIVESGGEESTKVSIEEFARPRLRASLTRIYRFISRPRLKS